MIRLYLICGHGAGDPGAGGWLGGTYQEEAACVRELARRIKLYGGAAVEVAPSDRNAYVESGLASWPIPDGAQVVELHMDSAGAGARGGHVIYKAGTSPDAYDVALAGRIAEFFPGRASSLVGRSDLKNVNQAARRGVAYRLVENGFISDEGDLGRFFGRIDDLAMLYLDVFGIEPAVRPGDAAGQPAREEQPAASGSQAVREMQAALNDKLGAFKSSRRVDLTGVYDAGTQRALVELYQLSANYDYGCGLVVDGVCGGATRAAMAAHPVGMGWEQHGNDVWAVKAALVGNGHTLDLSTWDWEGADADALAMHQRAWGLDPDGVCGSRTLPTLVDAAAV